MTMNWFEGKFIMTCSVVYHNCSNLCVFCLLYHYCTGNFIDSLLFYAVFVCLFQVDFNALQIETLAEQMRQQEQERRQNLINEGKLKKVTTEISGLYYIS